MIDIARLKRLFPLKDFEDVSNLFKFNIDSDNGQPNLALLSIVTGLIEHSLVTVTDKDDLATNSRPIQQRKDVIQRKFINMNRLVIPSNTLSSSERENIYRNHLKQEPSNRSGDTDSNEPDSSEDSNISSPDQSSSDNLPIPEIEFEVVETLYKKFVDQFKNNPDFKDIETIKTNLTIKKISDSVWEHLSNSYYKDKAHLQSIFSYLTTNKLDCFGLAFAVIAGCQILGLKNIYLALSEDHAWVMFDLRQEELARKEREIKEYTDNNLPIPTCAMHGTCEVTWHGKANSDKRGQPVTYKNCWLYTNGYAVRCDIKMCVAALVNSINPSINSNTESEVLALLQQRLLWLLFDRETCFPMSLGGLGELENLCPTPGAKLTPLKLFNLGIRISRTEYNDSHVYPYTYLASFFYNNGRFKEALETWADSSAVMTRYNYSRDDEEIYKEFFEVANELIPSMLKVLTAGGLEPGRVSLIPSLQDPECLALIIKFYDNICCWEEGSSTPVLHIGWAKNFVSTVLKFSSIIRGKIKLVTEDEWIQRNQISSKEVYPVVDLSSSQLDHKLSLKHENVSTQDDKASKQELSDEVDSPPDKNDKSTVEYGSRGRKRALSIDGKPDSSGGVTGKIKFQDAFDSDSQTSLDDLRYKSSHPARENRLESDSDNNVIVVLKSRKIAGVRDLLHAERLNKTAVELQLTAQSQCAVKGRLGGSYSTDFISSGLTTLGGSTRSKRSLR